MSTPYVKRLLNRIKKLEEENEALRISYDHVRARHQTAYSQLCAVHRLIDEFNTKAAKTKSGLV
jgi:hypothetical protein